MSTNQKIKTEPRSPSEIDEEVNRLDYQVQDLKRRIANLRRQRPREEVRDYALTDWNDEATPLSSLFGARDSLILIHNMGKSCSYCTMWADGFNGLLPHLSNLASFVVTSPDEPAVQRAFAESRGWRFPMYSIKGTTFAKDMGFVHDEGFMPGMSIFQKSDHRILRVSRAEFGPGDDFCPVWHFVGLMPPGADDWEPKDAY